MKVWVWFCIVCRNVRADDAEINDSALLVVPEKPVEEKTLLCIGRCYHPTPHRRVE